MKFNILSILLLFLVGDIFSQNVDPRPPSDPVRLVMIHASIGRAWLCNGTNYGNLGGKLGQNNYYVSDLDKDYSVPENSTVFHNNYADHGTSPGHIYTWFCDTTVQGNGLTKSENVMSAVYGADHGCSVDSWLTYKRDYMANPGGENTIVVFKPTHVASSVKDDNSDYDWTSIIEKDAANSRYTLSNAKQLYIRMVEYYKKHPEKMFVLITPPPFPVQSQEDLDAGHAANARTLNNWLVYEWLQDLDHENKNVYVFDLFNVFTDTANHHRVVGDYPESHIEHVTSATSTNFGFPGYYVNVTDPHPGPGGSAGSIGDKAAAEFIPLLNAYYHRYQAWLEGSSATAKKNIKNINAKLNSNGAIVKYSIPQASFKKGFSLSVHSLSGKVVASISLDKNIGKIDLNKISKNGLSSGQYVLTIESDKNQKVLSEKVNFIKN